MPPQTPEAFLHLKSLVRVHIKQILAIDKKPPMAAVVLLIVVACEALSKLFGRPRDETQIPSLAALERLAKTLGVPVTELLR